MTKKFSFETFQPIQPYQVNQMTVKEPWSFNGRVGIRKYRITVEEIEEPIEVLRSRLKKLWDDCDNHHQWMPLQAEASKLEIALKLT